MLLLCLFSAQNMCRVIPDFHRIAHLTPPREFPLRHQGTRSKMRFLNLSEVYVILRRLSAQVQAPEWASPSQPTCGRSATISVNGGEILGLTVLHDIAQPSLRLSTFSEARWIRCFRQLANISTRAGCIGATQLNRSCLSSCK